MSTVGLPYIDRYTPWQLALLAALCPNWDGFRALLDFAPTFIVLSMGKVLRPRKTPSAHYPFRGTMPMMTSNTGVTPDGPGPDPSSLGSHSASNNIANVPVQW